MNKRLPLLYILLAFALWSCEEISPIISPVMEVENVCSEPASLGTQARQVLIEEFTGVRCVNCPAGSQALQELKEQYGERLVAVSIHAGSFSPPYPDSYDTLRTPTGESILSFLGEPLGYPTAVINRKRFPGGFNLQLGRNVWPGAIAQELETPPVVQLDINPLYNSENRLLEACVTVELLEDLSGQEVFLSVFLAEDKVVDLQLTPGSSTPDPNYVHKHVFRASLTNFAGNLLQGELSSGTLLQRSFAIELLDKWKSEDCSLVAFVHVGGDTKEVLQAQEAAIE